jgi:hypothetical protein
MIFIYLLIPLPLWVLKLVAMNTPTNSSQIDTTFLMTIDIVVSTPLGLILAILLAVHRKRVKNKYLFWAAFTANAGLPLSYLLTFLLIILAVTLGVPL